MVEDSTKASSISSGISPDKSLAKKTARDAMTSSMLRHSELVKVAVSMNTRYGLDREP